MDGPQYLKRLVDSHLYIISFGLLADEIYSDIDNLHILETLKMVKTTDNLKIIL